MTSEELAKETIELARNSSKKLDELLGTIAFISTPHHSAILLDAGIFVLYDHRNPWMEMMKDAYTIPTVDGMS